MEVPETPTKLINQFRSWFHPKDRSVYLAANCLAYLSNGAYFSNAFIAETALTGSAASVTFSNIPQGFRHLQILMQARVDTAAEVENARLRFNTDSGANYDFERLTANSATVSGDAFRSQSGMELIVVEGANSRSANFALTWVFVSGYSRSDAEKSAMALSSSFGNLSADADMFLAIRTGHWRNTNVVTSITIIPTTGPNFVTGSRFQLYGIL